MHGSLIHATMLIQATAPAPVTDPASLQINSLLEFLVKGGWAMIPIALCSLVAMAIITERLMVLRRGRVIPRDFVSSLQQVAGDPPRALAHSRSNGSPIANILTVALQRAGEPVERYEKHVEEAGQREVLALRHRMRVLSVLPQVSTMLGLLGTIFGMIKTFQAVALTSEALGKTEMLAEGIFEAWTCTAAGLLVAIPVLIAYHYLLGKIDALVGDLDRAVLEWTESEKARTSSAATIIEPRRVTSTPAQHEVVSAVAPA
jgi:biopolymer transport protein ExbB